MLIRSFFAMIGQMFVRRNLKEALNTFKICIYPILNFDMPKFFSKFKNKHYSMNSL